MDRTVLIYLKYIRYGQTDGRTNKSTNCQRERGQWDVYYTSPQKFDINVFLFVGLTTMGTLVNFG